MGTRFDEIETLTQMPRRKTKENWSVRSSHLATDLHKAKEAASHEKHERNSGTTQLALVYKTPIETNKRLNEEKEKKKKRKVSKQKSVQEASEQQRQQQQNL